MTVLLSVLGGYLLGSIPFGYIVGRFVSGKDVREGGSGATGATNIARQLGLKWAIPVAILDIAKGALPVVLTISFFDNPVWLPAATGIAAIVGHIFPVWIRFRGGKGVSTALGVAIVISPWGTLVALIAFVAAFAVARFVSIGSLAAVVAYFIAVFVFGAKIDASGLDTKIFAAALPIIVIWTHRSNISRIIKGKELRVKGQRD